ncbi:hypothetical protein LIER_38539 [Lithospermum erythrorhizon]|uniref:RNase H type-1 domain-containing protein n=1 Tax=Lithospermum erythrorhizon TaxID=34254 RepID=A0AAV3Q3V5_LITER
MYEWWRLVSRLLGMEGEDGDVEQLACVIWYWWKNRCSVSFGETQQPLESIFNAGIKLAIDYLEANKKTLVPVPNSHGGNANEVQEHWQAPGEGRYKFNCDASFFKESCACTLGMIIRDAQGDFFGASYCTVPLVLQALIAEALTVREGLELARRYGWYNIKDIRCQGRLLNATFRYVTRRSKNVAHLIAHWNCGLEKEATWLQSPPHWLIATLLSDCTS